MLKFPKQYVDRETGELRDCIPGLEYPDPTPLEVPVGYSRPLSLREEMQLLIRQAFSVKNLEGSEIPTFEEEDDFDVPEGEDLVSGYELSEEQLARQAKEFEGEDPVGEDPVQGDLLGADGTPSPSGKPVPVADPQEPRVPPAVG